MKLFNELPRSKLTGYPTAKNAVSATSCGELYPCIIKIVLLFAFSLIISAYHGGCASTS